MTSNQDNTLEDISANSIPKWLNEQFFINIFDKKYLLKNDKVKSIKIISVKPASKPGYNYSLGLFRVKIEIQSNQINELFSLIIKFGVESHDSFDELAVYAKEIRMYSDVIPAFENEYKQRGENIQLAAYCYATFLKPVEILVVEDLNVKNYRVHNRFHGLDMEHSMLFLTKLAKYHAASVCYYEKHGEYGDQFRTPFRPELVDSVKAFSDGLYPFYLESIKNNVKLCHLAEKIENFYPTHYDEVFRVTSPNPKRFNVLSHGDCWITNFLFSYDKNEKPNDILLIDFQISYWTSPVVDLLYFFVSSTNIDVKANGFDELIHFYHTQLVRNLNKLEYTKLIPTLRDLHLDILDRGFFATYLTFQVMVVALMDEIEGLSIPSLMARTEDTTEMKRNIFKSSHYLANLEVMCLWLERKGFFDIK